MAVIEKMNEVTECECNCNSQQKNNTAIKKKPSSTSQQSSNNISQINIDRLMNTVAKQKFLSAGGNNKLKTI